MAIFPIYGYFVGDHIPHLVAVDTDDTMAQVAEKVAAHSVGRRVRPRAAGNGFEALIGGRLIAETVVLGSLGLRPLDWVDVRYRE